MRENLLTEYFLTLLVAAAFTYLLTPLVRRGAVRIGAMHAARDRDVHVVPIPLLGGLAMYAGLAAGLYVAGRLAPLDSVFTAPGTQGGLGMTGSLLLAGGLLVAVGCVDDRWGLNPLSKLAAQVAAGVIVYSGAQIPWLPQPGGGTLSLSPNQSLALTVLVVVATINAINFIDGLDGLAAGIVCIGALSFFIYYYTLTGIVGLSAESGPALISVVLAGICLGFLPHNFYPARIFMGDTGAMLLGLLLAYAVISNFASIDPAVLAGHSAYATGTANRFPEVLPLLPPAAMLVIPYGDMLLAVVRRTRAGIPVFAPDRGHLHHRLLDIGHSHRSSVLIMYLWAGLFSGTVVWLSISNTPLFVFIVVTLAAVLALLLMSMPRLRWWRRGAGPAAAADAAMLSGADLPPETVPPPATALAPGAVLPAATVLPPEASRSPVLAAPTLPGPARGTETSPAELPDADAVHAESGRPTESARSGTYSSWDLPWSR